MELFALLDGQEEILALLELLLELEGRLLSPPDVSFGAVVLALFVLEELLGIKQLSCQLLVFSELDGILLVHCSLLPS